MKKRVVFATVIALFSLSACVTYPRYKKTYECNDQQKEKLSDSVISCIHALPEIKKSDIEEIVDECHGVALKSTCTPFHSFERVSLPFFSVTAEIPCNKANDLFETYVCSEVDK